MEITEQRSGDILTLHVNGRLDSYWAEPLARRLEEVIREGAHRLHLDLSEVVYLSSAGIRILIKFHRQLRNIQGSFTVIQPSPQVKSVLELAGLQMLFGEEPAVAQSEPASPPPTTVATPATITTPASSPTPAPRPATPAAPTATTLEQENATFEVFTHTLGATLTCQTIGQPELLVGSRFTPSDSRSVPFPEQTFAVGLGAFGGNFSECKDRFGEFLAVAGAAAYLPTDGSNVPDYLLTTGTFVPSVEVLYALACRGQFAHLARFENKKETRPVTLLDLLTTSFDIARTETIGVVIVAESAGLMGAALRRSPALGPSTDAPFTHPRIRQWLSFTAERAYSRSLTLVAGVATRNATPALAPFVRPLGKGTDLAGHFHAAAFSYRPLQKGALDPKTTITTMFEAETLQGVLHLFNDDREAIGAGQSEFVRGACWIGPVVAVA